MFALYATEDHLLKLKFINAFIFFILSNLLQNFNNTCLYFKLLSWSSLYDMNTNGIPNYRENQSQINMWCIILFYKNKWPSLASFWTDLNNYFFCFILDELSPFIICTLCILNIFKQRYYVGLWFVPTENAFVAVSASILNE